MFCSSCEVSQLHHCNETATALTTGTSKPRSSQPPRTTCSSGRGPRGHRAIPAACSPLVRAECTRNSSLTGLSLAEIEVEG